MSEPVQTLFGKKAFAITPSDATVYSPPCWVYVGGAGNVAIVDALGSAAVTFTAPPVGSMVPVQASKVMATGTTATLLVGIQP